MVHEESARREAVEKVQASAVSHGLRVMGMEPSPLPGQDGNVEYFLWCKNKYGVESKYSAENK